MRPEYVPMTHKDAGEAQVPPHRVEHYESKGWKVDKSAAKSSKSSTARSSNPAPQGADTASTKEG